jgi:thioredoxin reductase (NADPH)
MVRPVLLAVDDEPAARSSIEGELRKRYGADYEVICESSGAAALGALEQVKERGGQVALVLADLWMPDMTGIELLTKAHALDPAAKRALLTGWGDRQVGDRLVRAAVLGQIDNWGLKPWQPGDEGLPPAGRRPTVRVGTAAPFGLPGRSGGRRAVVGPRP